MQTKRIHYALAALSFLVAAFTYLSTMQPSIPFWDCGEFLGAAATLGISHPPGAPFMTLVGRFFELIVPLSDPADLNNQGLNSVVSSNGEVHMRFTGTLPPHHPEYILNQEITGNLWNPSLPNANDGTDPLTPGVYWTNNDNGTAAINNYSCGSFVNRKNGNLLPLSVVLSDTSDSLYLYNEGMSWYGNSIDLQHGIDTLRLYCRRHPFADSYLLYGGGIYAGNGAFKEIDYDISLQNDTAIPGEAHAYDSPHKDMIQYNWLVDQQPLNMDPAVQKDILHYLLGCAAGFDRNLACNLAINFMNLYPDSLWKATCWSFDSSVRVFMHRSKEDTTPFYPITLPLSHVPIPGAGVSEQVASSASLALSPNPASSSLNVDFSLAHGGQALILIYDETGNTVKAVVNGPRSAGPNEATVSLSDLPSGHYFVRLASGGDVVTEELIVQH